MITVSELKHRLEGSSRAETVIRLPDGRLIPAHFHITEVGHVSRRFIDCGGKVHHQESCLLQAWVADDTAHRLPAGKLAEILSRFGQLTADDELPVELEYEEESTSQYTVAGVAEDDDSLILELAPKHTDCLAKDVCLPAEPASSCCSGTGCC